MKEFALQNSNMSMMEVENVVNFHMKIMMNLIFYNSIVDNVNQMLLWIVPLLRDVMIVSTISLINECPSLYQHRPKNAIGKKVKVA